MKLIIITMLIYIDNEINMINRMLVLFGNFNFTLPRLYHLAKSWETTITVTRIMRQVHVVAMK